MDSVTKHNAVTMLSVNQRRWRKSTGFRSSGADTKTVCIHMHDYFVANFVPRLYQWKTFREVIEMSRVTCVFLTRSVYAKS